MSRRAHRNADARTAHDVVAMLARGPLVAVVSAPPLDFTGILAAWDSGDPATRRDLLASLFDALNVEHGTIAAVLPRADRAAQVAALIEYVVAAEGEGFEPPRAWRPLRFSRPLRSTTPASLRGASSVPPAPR